MKNINIIFILFLLLFSTCDINGPEQDREFAIYLLEDKNITMYNTPWDEFVDKTLEDTPFLSSEDIDFYDWSSRLFYLKTDKTFLRDFFIDSTYGLRYNGCPFIVTSGTQPLYSGLVYFSMHGIVIQYPKISPTDLDDYPYPDNLFYIQGPYGDGEDPRSLPEVKEALKEAGLFHAGIKVELDTRYGVSFHTVSGDTMEVQYRVLIRNLDQDALYVLDPDKLDGWMYQYFSSPPVFYDSLGNPLIRSSTNYIGTAPGTSEYANLDHYTLLLPGQSIKRVIRRGTYTNVKTGSYYTGIHYAAPVYTMTKSKRNNFWGRIWIGSTGSGEYNVSIQADDIISE